VRGVESSGRRRAITVDTTRDVVDGVVSFVEAFEQWAPSGDDLVRGQSFRLPIVEQHLVTERVAQQIPEVEIHAASDRADDFGYARLISPCHVSLSVCPAPVVRDI
jgi:hypothetical protein